MIGHLRGPRESISACAASTAAASASSRVEKLTGCLRVTRLDRVDPISRMVQSQTQVPSFCRQDLNVIDRPLWPDSGILAPFRIRHDSAAPPAKRKAPSLLKDGASGRHTEHGQMFHCHTIVFRPKLVLEEPLSTAI